MKTGWIRKVISTAAIAAMVLGNFSMPVYADENETIYGEPETIQVSSGAMTARENNFNENWKFYLGDNSSAANQNFNDSGWKDVTLPHDYSISQNFTTSGEAESGFLPGGTGWYRKKFTLSDNEANKRVVLNFDGVYSDAYVYVNGTYVGENHYGYTAFAFDITDQIICDGVTENLIAVKVVNNVPSSRWYSGSGIYRDVTLTVTDPVHVSHNGIYITTPNIAQGQGNVQMQIELQNDSNETAEVIIKNTVYNSDGAVVSATVENASTVSAGQMEQVTSSLVVDHPELWSPEHPNLYSVKTEVYNGDALVDVCNTEFGFRWYSFDNSGFYLNGQAMKLNGVCLHHDQGAVGAAAYNDAIYRQLSIMKDMGVNAVRVSHNPAAKDFIDICNRMGIMVVEEIFDGWVDAKNGNSNDFSKYFNVNLGSSNTVLGGKSSMTWAEFAVKSAVRRDRNDPSVILWSLCNEVQEGTYWTNVGTYASIAQNLINWIKEEDITRPATSGDNNRGGDSNLVAVLNTIRQNGGIIGFNYANSASQLANLAGQYGGVIIASETSSATNSRGIYSSMANNSNADGKCHLTSYDTSSVGWGCTAHDSIYNTMVNDCVAGEFVWTGFDYIGEPTPWNGTGSGSVSGRGAIPNSSYFGIVDTAGFEKDTYYLYRSQWNQTDTTLHLVTAWDADNMLVSNGKTPVVIYSNAPIVKLYRGEKLIGTAVRQVNRTNAGHEYYTYSVSSNDNSICSAVSASASASLYATFNVAYAAGTISAIAYDDNEVEITNTHGKKVVSTPGTAMRLAVSQNKKVMMADNTSLAYIEVEVQDAEHHLDTTATNTINFALSGDGEIVGVDNGDQATTEKYQQSSVLKSPTSAKIAAYAGKALVIVKSTGDAGSIQVQVSSDGLEGGNVTIETVDSSEGEIHSELMSYTMIKDYSVKTGTVPVLQTNATGMMADGTEINGTITWDEVSPDIYQTAGDYTIRGTLSFNDSLDQGDIIVLARLHVIADVIALRNVSAATMEGAMPKLPDTVKGILEDGTLSGEFNVTWDQVTADQFMEVGQTVVINGSAVILGNHVLPVTCTVRVAELVNTESNNIAPQALVLSQDIEEGKQSDNLNSIINGITKPGDDTNERWTNWNNRFNSESAAITFTWATAHMLSGINLYYYIDNCSNTPAGIKVEYSLNGENFEEIGVSDEILEQYTLGEAHRYTFNKVINPVALKLTLTQQDGTTGNHCVGLTECEIMSYAGSVEQNSSADLSGITVDGAALEEFSMENLEYTVSGSVITAISENNAGITILPADGENIIRILTVSENGISEKLYTITLEDQVACAHENTELKDVKAATCTEEGYTGDCCCTECKEVIERGKIIPATGHVLSVQNKKDAACTVDGYTGDVVCSMCETVISAGQSIAATGHSWNSGVITKPATVTEEGIKTFTCTICGETRTEIVAKLDPEPTEQTEPTVTLAVSAGKNGKITLTGKFADYENADNYYTVTAHGFVYIQQSRLGTRNLTVNFAGRTKVNVGSYKDDGSFTYNMTPTNANVKYAVRAFLEYTDAEGRKMYQYSDTSIVSYNGIK